MITSNALCTIPFQASCDSTRLNMASKQIKQAITHPNCEIPYVISRDYRLLVDNCYRAIKFANHNGKVLFKNDDLLIVLYENGKIEKLLTPPVRKTHSIFGSTLRFSLDEDQEFKCGDILYEYDCFKNGIPSYGYNTFSAFMPFFGYNHEDSLICSESFAQRTKVKFVDAIYIPIYEYTLLQKIYSDQDNSLEYFPGPGQRVKNGVVCCSLIPKNTEILKSSNNTEVKNRVISLIKNMNLSGLLNMDSRDIVHFSTEKYETEVEDGIVTGFKIHKLTVDNGKKSKPKLIDENLQNILERLYTNYGDFISDTYTRLMKIFPKDYVKSVLKQHYVYADRNKVLKGMNLKNAVYLLEFEITKEYPTTYGDKFANRYANKGVISHILPDELAPIALKSNKRIDMIYNPFGVFSRMNLGQILEGIVGKTVMSLDTYIKKNPKHLKNSIVWLTENVIRHFNDDGYYQEVKDNIIRNLDDEEFQKRFIENITQTNLFVEAPSFSEVNLNDLIKNCIDPNEPVLLKRDLIKYMKQKLKLDVPFLDEDITIPNVFCAPIYTLKLYKLTRKIMSCRDLGPVKSITQQPLRGRANKGGSRIGQMEFEALIAHGCEKIIKEFTTVKSDWNDSKRDLVHQLIASGQYIMDDSKFNGASGRTKKVVDIILKFLKE